MALKHWIMKSEPTDYAIEDLAHEKETQWIGVRNYQARNFMIKDMKIGDPVLFYHSQTPPVGVAGQAVVSHLAWPDPTQFDPESKYFDPKATHRDPRWHAVNVTHCETFARIVTISEMRQDPKLTELWVLKKGQRLSIGPITKAQFQQLVQLAHQTPS